MSYGSWLVGTSLGIAPCYTISELLFGIPESFIILGYCTMLCNSWIDRLFRNQCDWRDIVCSRDPPDLKKNKYSLHLGSDDVFLLLNLLGASLDLLLWVVDPDEVRHGAQHAELLLDIIVAIPPRLALADHHAAGAALLDHLERGEVLAIRGPRLMLGDAQLGELGLTTGLNILIKIYVLSWKSLINGNIKWM